MEGILDPGKGLFFKIVCVVLGHWLNGGIPMTD